MKINHAVEAVSDAANDCAAVDLDAMSGTELRQGLAEFRTGISRLEAEYARMVHAAERVGAHLGTGARDTAEWVGKRTGTSTGKNRVSASLGEAMAKSPELAAALVSGRVSNGAAPPRRTEETRADSIGREPLLNNAIGSEQLAFV